MSAVVIASVVEGHGEVKALPTLLHRIVHEHIDPNTVLITSTPHRLPSQQMRRRDELAKVLRMQAARVRGRGGILVVRDGDDSDRPCPVELASELALAAGGVQVPVQVVIACREYEAWFLAAASSLCGHPAVRDDVQDDPEPERHRGAKERLRRLMIESYQETLHQQEFSSQLDVKAAASASRSFRRLVHAVEILVGTAP